jgi:hypothetical protein
MTMKIKQLQAKLEAVFPRLVLSPRRGREPERGAINTLVILEGRRSLKYERGGLRGIYFSELYNSLQFSFPG